MEQAIGTAATAAGGMVTGITHWLQLVALVLVLGFAAWAVWLARAAKDAKKVIDAETELRKEKRDNQIGQLQSRFNDRFAEMNGKLSLIEERERENNAKIKAHLEDEKESDNKSRATMRDIDDRLRRIEGSMISRSDVETKIDKVENEIKSMNERLSVKMDRMTDLLNNVLGSIATGSTHTKRLLEGGA
jgi:uncharacterized protein HemX